MTDTVLEVLDGAGAAQELLVQQNAGSLTPYHVEDTAQRTALLAAINALATASAQGTGNTSLASILAKLNASLAVTGTFFQATQPVSVTALPLPSGAASAANQSTEISALAAIIAALDTPDYSASGITAVTQTFTGTGRSATFTPPNGRNFNVSGWGTFAASVQLERSFDAGTTWLPITAGGSQLYNWTGPFSENAAEDENGVIYSLHCTAFTSGTVNFRLSA